jgi:hypothetical protein
MRWDKIRQLHLLGMAIERQRRTNSFTVLYYRNVT